MTALSTLLLLGAAAIPAADLPQPTFHWSFDHGMQPDVCAEDSALQHIDLLAWHPYYHERPEDGYYAALRRVNALMDRYGGRKPMISTEFGTGGVSDWALHIPWTADGWRRYDEREQVEILVRQCVMGLGEGAVKLYWYKWREERIQTGPDTFGLVCAGGNDQGPVGRGGRVIGSMAAGRARPRHLGQRASARGADHALLGAGVRARRLIGLDRSPPCVRPASTRIRVGQASTRIRAGRASTRIRVGRASSSTPPGRRPIDR